MEQAHDKSVQKESLRKKMNAFMEQAVRKKAGERKQGKLRKQCKNKKCQLIIEEFQGIIPLNMILPANKRKEGGYGHGDKKSNQRGRYGRTV